MPSVWDGVPVEIYDEIFSYISYRSMFQSEHDVRPRNEDYVHTFDFLRSVSRHGTGSYEYPCFLKSQLRLRLVSRAFNRAMTRVYFKHEVVNVKTWEESTVQKLRDMIIDRKSTVAPFIANLNIMISYEEYSGLFDQDRSGEGHGREEDAAELNLMNQSVRAFLAMFEELVARLPKLESITVSIPEEWRSEGPFFPEFSDSEDESGEKKIVDHGPIYELDLLELLRNSIATIFSSPRISIPFLTYIHLTLPSAYDFSIIGAKVSDTMALRLRHLYLEYIDGTGPGGDLYYTRHWQGDSDSDGDEDHPYSNLQNRHPNTKYTVDMCRLINRCHNLESLGLRCTQRIDLEHLDWNPTSTGLKTIYIARAITSPEKLISLLSPEALRVFHIYDISLTSGTWQSVFEHLGSCLLLRYLHVYQLIYDRFAASAHHARRNGRPWENVSVIWSEHDEDERRLCKLIREVQGRNGTVTDDLASGVYEDEWEEEE